jgi:phage-related minor tail protein
MIGLDADKMALSIAKGGESAQSAFLATVIALANMKDPLKQNQAGVALFGTQWEDVRKNVITELTEGKTGLGDFKGATDEATNAITENNPVMALRQGLRDYKARLLRLYNHWPIFCKIPSSLQSKV